MVYRVQSFSRCPLSYSHRHIVIVQDIFVLLQRPYILFDVHKSLWSLTVGELLSFVSSSRLSRIVTAASKVELCLELEYTKELT